MNRLLAGLAIPFLTMAPAEAASLSKTYSYFTIGGTTLTEIEAELAMRGPEVKSTGSRHPGATRMEFTTRVNYGETNGRCSVVGATVSVKADVILPRWRVSRRSDDDTRLIWDTLASDIRRHEESHIVIARNHARDLERELVTIRNQRDCETAQEKAQATTSRVLARHDAAQDHFDKVEGINFESRLIRLLRNRLKRMDAAEAPG